VELQSLISNVFYYYFEKIFFRNKTIPIEYNGQGKSGNLSLGPTLLYNAMIYPFTRMVIRGAIWYQG
jgi:hypothetical protein